MKVGGIGHVLHNEDNSQSSIEGEAESLQWVFDKILKVVREDIVDSQLRPVTVNGHNPRFPSMRVFPEIGEFLTSDAVGKIFVRVYPYKGCDWSGIPFGQSENSIRREEREIIEVSPDKIAVRYIFDGTNRQMHGSWNDGYWAPVEKYRAHIQLETTAQPEQSMPATEEVRTPFFEKWWPGGASLFDEELPRVDFKVHVWYAHACLRIHEVSEKDYSFQPPKARGTQPVGSNSSSDKPHIILGLPEQMRDLKAIKARWQQLVLQHHPDKGGNEEHFKKIDAAYKQLKKEIEGEAFSLDGCDELESALVKARSYYSHLLQCEEMPLMTEYSDHLTSWQQLHQVLKQVKLEGKEPVFEDEVLDMQDVADQKVKFWKFRNKLLSLNLSLANLTQSIEQLIELAKTSDLANIELGWIVTKNCYVEANMVFYDKLVALYRTQAEKYIVAKEMDKALAVRREVEAIAIKITKIKLNFVLLRKPTRVQKRLFEEDLVEMMSNLGKSKPREEFAPHFEEMPSKSKQPKREKASSAATDEPPTPKKDNKEEIKEYQAVRENLRKNLEFFQVG